MSNLEKLITQKTFENENQARPISLIFIGNWITSRHHPGLVVMLLGINLDGGSSAVGPAVLCGQASSTSWSAQGRAARTDLRSARRRVLAQVAAGKSGSRSSRACRVRGHQGHGLPRQRCTWATAPRLECCSISLRRRYSSRARSAMTFSEILGGGFVRHRQSGRDGAGRCRSAEFRRVQG